MSSLSESNPTLYIQKINESDKIPNQSDNKNSSSSLIMPLSVSLSARVPVSRRTPLPWPFRSMISTMIHSGLWVISTWCIPRISSWTIFRTPWFKFSPCMIISIIKTRLSGSPNNCVIVVVMVSLRKITRWHMILPNSPHIIRPVIWFFDLWRVGTARVTICWCLCCCEAEWDGVGEGGMKGCGNELDKPSCCTLKLGTGFT